ncbi:MAG: tRNA (adenosine(37)-N6)-dimethylallyltransferase MiaA [Fimbriimonadaceae bacterium]|nr:tRNA (adenosine(37)-N6)-dimethylallyltransferase MiaA [Fimbriimonadaceae bacterium]
MPEHEPLMIAVMGPTASGKTALAERIAERYNAQLFAADAFQVYRGFDIGTAKPAQKDRYRLVDIKSPTESIAVGEWVQLAVDELVPLYEKRRNVVFVGGTGLYVRALFQGYGALFPPADPETRERIREREAAGGMEALVQWLREIDKESSERIDIHNPVRVRRAIEKALCPKVETLFSVPPYKRVKMSLQPDKDDLNLRIKNRVSEMVQNGWVAEVEALRRAGISDNDPSMRAIGYRTLLKVCTGEIALEQAIEATEIETRQYAKRQRTWLRSEPDVRVIPRFGDTEEAFSEACQWIEII